MHPIPLLENIPILGTLFFKQDVMTYFSFVLIAVAWWWIFRTRPGLMLRAVGERPAAAFARGAKVNRLRYLYTVLGGALVGLAGPMYSLSVKAGWKGTISGLDGLGWIVLAIVIFGAWNPVRVAFGAYLFGLLQWLSVVLQPEPPGHPLPGAAGGAVPADDPHAAAGEHRQRRVGGAGAGRAAGGLAKARGPHPALAARGPATQPGSAVRARLSSRRPGRAPGAGFGHRYMDRVPISAMWIDAEGWPAGMLPRLDQPSMAVRTTSHSSRGGARLMRRSPCHAPTPVLRGDCPRRRASTIPATRRTRAGSVSSVT